jgi:hypothetical protein
MNCVICSLLCFLQGFVIVLLEILNIVCTPLHQIIAKNGTANPLSALHYIIESQNDYCNVKVGLSTESTTEQASSLSREPNYLAGSEPLSPNH